MEFTPIDRSQWEAERIALGGADREAGLSRLAIGILAAVTGAETAGALAKAIGCDRKTIARHWDGAPRFTPAVTSGGVSWTPIHATAVAAAVAALRADGGHWLPRFGELAALAIEPHSGTLTAAPLARTRRIDAARTLARFKRLGLITDTGTILTAPADHPPLAVRNRGPASTPGETMPQAPLFEDPDVERIFERYIEARQRWVSMYAADPEHAQAQLDKFTLNDARRRIILRAIAATDADTVLAAVAGWLESPWHRGENPEGKVHWELSTILADSERIQRHADACIAVKAVRPGSPVGNFDPAADGPIALPPTRCTAAAPDDVPAGGLVQLGQPARPAAPRPAPSWLPKPVKVSDQARALMGAA